MKQINSKKNKATKITKYFIKIPVISIYASADILLIYLFLFFEPLFYICDPLYCKCLFDVNQNFWPSALTAS